MLSCHQTVALVPYTIIIGNLLLAGGYNNVTLNLPLPECTNLDEISYISICVYLPLRVLEMGSSSKKL